MSKKRKKKDIKIFYDGSEIKGYHHLLAVEGFTTNTSFVAESVLNEKVSGIYKEYAIEQLGYAKGRPISFQVVSESLEDIERDAREILQWSRPNKADNVYCKIPVVTANGESTVKLIKKLHEEGLQINVTTVYTKQQITSVSKVLGNETPAIVSIFAGGISDTGKHPDSYVIKAVEAFSDRDNVEILWAGCQRLLSIKEAEECGADIVTVPGNLLGKTGRFGVPLNKASVAKSKLFYDDAKKAKLRVTD